MTTADTREAGPKLVKLLFHPNDDYYTTTETLWAEDLGDGRYRLRNLPFYIYGLGFEDVVRARPSAEGMLEFVEVVERSGSSTFRIMLRDGVGDEKFEQYWRPLRTLGCTLERARDGFYAVDAPLGVSLDEIVRLLRAGAADEIWDWEAGYRHDAPIKQGMVRPRLRRHDP